MPLTDSLVAWWGLGEASGTRADSHGANHLTDNNTVGSAAGKRGDAADFEASNSEYLSIADSAALSMGDIDFTVAAWVKLESKPAFASIVSKYETSGDQREYWLDYAAEDDRFRFTASPDGVGGATVVAGSTGAPSVGVWYFVVAWHDAAANTLNIQVNDGPADSLSHTGGVFDGSSPLHVGALGRAAATFFWDGHLDEVAVWKRVLAAAERTDLYNGGAGRGYAYVAGGTTLTGTPEIGPLGVTPVTLTARKRSGLAPVSVSLAPVSPTVHKRAAIAAATVGVTPVLLTVRKSGLILPASVGLTGTAPDRLSSAPQVDPASVGLAPVTLGTRKRAALTPAAVALESIPSAIRRRIGLSPVVIELRANAPAGRKRATLDPAVVELLVIGAVEELPVPHASAVWRAGARSTVWWSSQRSTVWRA